MDHLGPKEKDVAFIHTTGLGWASVTSRYLKFQNDLGWNLNPYAIEQYEPKLGSLWRLRVTPWTFSAAIAGRRAYKQAAEDGYKRFFFVTQAHALLLPRVAPNSVLAYGDATWQQIGNLPGYGMKYDWGTSWLENRGMRSLRSRGAHMACMSNWYQSNLRSYYGFSAAQTSHLPLMVDSSFWTPAAKRRQIALRVLFIGGDFVRKGGSVLLEASRLLGDRIEFVFVTKNPELIPDGYEVHSNMKPDSLELRAVMQSCDLLALPTRGDTNSHVLVEAAMCGLPAIVTSIGGIPELVEDGTTGTLMNNWQVDSWAMAIERYASDRSLLYQQGLAARKLAAMHHSVESHLSSLKLTLASLWGEP